MCTHFSFLPPGAASKHTIVMSQKLMFGSHKGSGRVYFRPQMCCLPSQPPGTVVLETPFRLDVLVRDDPQNPSGIFVVRRLRSPILCYPPKQRFCCMLLQTQSVTPVKDRPSIFQSHSIRTPSITWHNLQWFQGSFSQKNAGMDIWIDV